MIRRLLLERVSSRGICRVVKVSLTWLLDFIVKVYGQLPGHLYAQAQVAEREGDVILYLLDAQADELWSFVGNKENKQWVWIAIDAHTKQVIAFYVGDRSHQSAQELWERIPDTYKYHATFYTDDWEAYKGVIPPNQHKAVSKQSGKTSIVERFNCTLRQRVSHLVCSSLSFSKKLENHIGAIKYFICNYKLSITCVALPALVLLTPASPSGIIALKPSVIGSFWSGFAKWGFWRKPMRQTFNEAAYSMLHLLPVEEQKRIFSLFVYESGRAVYEIGFWFLDRKGAAQVDEAKVTCPVLVVAGSQDRITPASVVRKVAAKYKAVSTYKEFPNHAHWVIDEPRWQEVAEYVSDWLDRV